MKIENNTVLGEMHASREISEANTRLKKLSTSEVTGAILKMGHTVIEEMKPTLKKVSSNVQPAAIQEQLAALTGENNSAIDS
ncbi:TPA: hypothetical protein OB786_000289 [Escherichia fergusonii]|uniref:hypothetical protein n=1 Tax=Escherichia fergusonii TaxID=564 RepID=UPI000F66C238|nr:hypothetical protein [Escherichia fergusonii]EHG5995785.1 hypothetical protein [Escherichia fergusonii]MBA8502674.1 hypothetical protein [Escherichia fergusonii]QCZ33114.1 hypothetical protein D8Z79_015435 [Escherichia fergusonii]HAI1303481.1 hypothetical protein [Escherichia fergusonii]HCO8232343.1 hypothetical protein [Escherichia fergusonii]